MKRIKIGLLTTLTIIAPIATVVSCGSEDKKAVSLPNSAKQAISNELKSAYPTMGGIEILSIEKVPDSTPLYKGSSGAYKIGFKTNTATSMMNNVIVNAGKIMWLTIGKQTDSKGSFSGEFSVSDRKSPDEKSPHIDGNSQSFNKLEAYNRIIAAL